jgi:hypothetical protein
LRLRALGQLTRALRFRRHTLMPGIPLGAFNRGPATDIPKDRLGQRASAFADDRFNARAKRLGHAGLVEQASGEAVVTLTRHREQHMLRPDETMTTYCGDLLGLLEKLLDRSCQFRHADAVS